MCKFLLFLLFVMPAYLSGQDFKNSKWSTSGQRIAEVSQFSQDVRNDFFRILTYQDMYGKPLTFFGTNYRAAPGNFLLEDGTVVQDNLNRIMVVTGLRFNENFFGGIVADGIENGYLDDSKPSSFQTNISQGLVYGGMMAGSLQFTAAWHNISPQKGINAEGALINTNLGDAQNRTVEPARQNRYMFSVYERNGLFLSYTTYRPNSLDPVTGGIVEGDTKSELMVRAQSHRRKLPDMYGLPFLQLERYTNTRLLNQNEEEPENILGSFGSDDIRIKNVPGDISFRTALHYRVRPLPMLDAVEAGGIWKINAHIEVGFRSFIRSQDGKPTLASDEYISFGFWNNARWAFTHSYNSPDRSTFVPFPGIHVYGFQVVYGISDIIKPLIPIIRARNVENFDD